MSLKWRALNPNYLDEQVSRFKDDSGEAAFCQDDPLFGIRVYISSRVVKSLQNVDILIDYFQKSLFTYSPRDNDLGLELVAPTEFDPKDKIISIDDLDELRETRNFTPQCFDVAVRTSVFSSAFGRVYDIVRDEEKSTPDVAHFTIKNYGFCRTPKQFEMILDENCMRDFNLEENFKEIGLETAADVDVEISKMDFMSVIRFKNALIQKITAEPILKDDFIKFLGKYIKTNFASKDEMLSKYMKKQPPKKKKTIDENQTLDATNEMKPLDFLDVSYMSIGAIDIVYKLAYLLLDFNYNSQKKNQFLTDWREEVLKDN